MVFLSTPKTDQILFTFCWSTVCVSGSVRSGVFADPASALVGQGHFLKGDRGELGLLLGELDQLVLELGVRVGRYPAVAGVYLLLASPFSSPLALAMN